VAPTTDPASHRTQNKQDGADNDHGNSDIPEADCGGAVRGHGRPSEDEDRDREIMAGDGSADKGVENLVEAEDVRRGVGPAAVIADGALA
jgi:hypothetical protein